MAMYAFLDELRTKEILARDATKEDKYRRFFCPNPDCDAHLHIVSVDGLVSAYLKLMIKITLIQMVVTFLKIRKNSHRTNLKKMISI